MILLTNQINILFDRINMKNILALQSFKLFIKKLYYEQSRINYRNG